jgi:hypothetical protein
MEHVMTTPLVKRAVAAAAATLFAGALLAGSIGVNAASQSDNAVKGAEQHSTQLAGGNKPKYGNG